MMSNTKVIKSALAVFLLHSCLVTVARATALSQLLITDVDVKLNTTTPTEDFVIEELREYAAIIASMDETLDAFQLNYESNLQTIITQRDFHLIKLQEVDHKLYPLRLLNDLGKHCIQKYEGKISTSASVNISITNCATTALSQYNFYAAPPVGSRTWLNTYYTNTLITSLNNCKKTYPDLESQNYTTCATKEIATADGYTAIYVKQFNTQMQAARCGADGRVATAIDCSFTIIFNTASMVGETYSLIDNCIQGLEFCPQCDPPKPTFYCPNQLSVSLNVSDYRSPTIKNPFYGLNGKIDCVLLNLKESSSI